MSQDEFDAHLTELLRFLHDNSNASFTRSELASSLHVNEPNINGTIENALDNLWLDIEDENNDDPRFQINEAGNRKLNRLTGRSDPLPPRTDSSINIGSINIGNDNIIGSNINVGNQNRINSPNTSISQDNKFAKWQLIVGIIGVIVAIAGVGIYLTNEISIIGPEPDTITPVIVVPNDMTIQATSSDPSPVTFSVSATDNVDGNLTPACSPASGSNFSIGRTTVTCIAIDAAGNSASKSFTITISEPELTPEPEPEPTPTPGPTSTLTEPTPPIAKIDAPFLGEPNKEIKFSGINSSDDNSIIAFDWSFGDGEYDSGMNVTHSYDLPNKYTVSLTVIDNDELPNSAIKKIEIKFPSYSDSLPDLKWKKNSFRIFPHLETNTYLIGEELQIYHTVENVNSQDLISFCVSLDIIHVDYEWTKHKEQCAKNSKLPNYTFYFKDSLSVPGKYQLKFNVDYKGEVIEENEKNNIFLENILIS